MIRLQHNGRLPIDGCAVVPAKPNPDARGCLYEIYRAEWPGAFPTVQWNACVSNAGVVRGVHVHVDYEEYYTLLAGRGILGLHDIRRDAPTFGRSITIDWRADDRCAVAIPHGVAHVLIVHDVVAAVDTLCLVTDDLHGDRATDAAVLQVPNGRAPEVPG